MEIDHPPIPPHCKYFRVLEIDSADPPHEKMCFVPRSVMLRTYTMARAARTAPTNTVETFDPDIDGIDLDALDDEAREIVAAVAEVRWRKIAEAPGTPKRVDMDRPDKLFAQECACAWRQWGEQKP